MEDTNCSHCAEVLAPSSATRRGRTTFNRTLNNSKCKVFELLTEIKNINTSFVLADHYLCEKCFCALSNYATSLEAMRRKYKIFADLSCRTSFLNNFEDKHSQPELAPQPAKQTNTKATQINVDVTSKQVQATVKTADKFIETKNPYPVADPKTPVHKKMRTALMKPKQRLSFQRTLASLIRGEMDIVKESGLFKLSPSVEECDFEHLQDSLRMLLPAQCPTIYAVLNGLCLKHGSMFGLNSKMTSILGIGIFNKYIRHGRVQKNIGLALWQTNASIRTFQMLQNMGLTTTQATIKNLLGNLIKDYDTPVIEWKKRIENIFDEKSHFELQLPAGSKRPAPLSPSLETQQPSSSKKARKSLLDAFNAVAISETEQHATKLALDTFEAETPDPATIESQKASLDNSEYVEGLSFTFDNLNKFQRKASYSTSSKDKMLNIVSLVAYFNRVPISVDDFINTSTKKAVDIPVESFLLTKEDEQMLINDHVQVVSDILISNLGFFAGLAGKVKSDKGKYHDYSCLKSKTINLGILPFDENTNHGMIQVMESIQRYCPVINDKKVIGVAVHGDGLTTDRQRSAQKIRMNSRTEEGKLSSIYPIVSDWHKRVKLLKEDLNHLFKAKEFTLGRGTMPQLRAAFGHSQAGMDLKTKFNYSYDLLRFSLHSYVCALAYQFLTEVGPDGTAKIESDGSVQIPDPSNLSEIDLKKILDDTALKIVQFSWHNIATASTQASYCICKTSMNEESKDWIGCSNYDCDTTWYHKSCITDHIHSTLKSGFVPSYNPLPTRKTQDWFCCKKCMDMNVDKVYMYSRYLMFAALQHESFKNAIRNNDGDKFMVYNKVHLIQFMNNPRSIYLRIALRMHLYLSGCAPKHIIHEMLYNSTINMVGKPGHNLEADLVNEFVNKLFKEDVIGIANQTPNSLELRSKAYGIVAEIVKELQSYLANENSIQKGGKDYEKWKEDIDKAMIILLQNNVFSLCGPRHHEGFKNLDTKHLYITDIEKYKEVLQEKCIDFDLVGAVWADKLEGTPEPMQIADDML